MKEKLNRLSTKSFKSKFYERVSDKFAVNPRNVTNNWFGRLFLGVPKAYIEETEKLLDKQLELQKRVQDYEKQQEILIFGK